MPRSNRRTRKSSTRGPQYCYEPLGMHFRIIGATESAVFGRCFIVAAEPHERTFRAEGFRFDTTEERNSLWEELHKRELKRLATKLKAQKAADKKNHDDDYDSHAAADNEERDSVWSTSYEPEDCGVPPRGDNDDDSESVIRSEDIVDSQIIDPEFAI